jgi:GNAT superfamily N-acetyltransferase
MSIKTHTIQSSIEFESVDAVYQDCFGVDSVPTSVQWTWWHRYPEGIIGLYADGKIIGGMSYWPINQSGFEALATGQIKEKELTEQHIDYTTPHGIYISEIAIAPLFRKKDYAALLLSYFEWQREKLSKPDSKLPVLALIYSPGGRKILEKIGFKLFRKATDMPDAQDLYRLI